MNWLKGNKNNLLDIEQYKSKVNINLSQKDYTSQDEENTSDVQYIQITLKHYPTTFDIQQELIKLQKEYDNSDEINSFTINNVEGWLDKQTRVAIKHAIDVIEEIDEESTYTLWLNNTPITLSITDIKTILTELELYAIKCYNTTKQHLIDISNINNRFDLFKYDISKDYPSKLEFTFE